VDIGKAFSTVFDDQSWLVKTLIGGVVSLIPFVGQVLVYGYALELMHDVMNGRERLPEWDDWGGKLVKGILAFVIYFVYSLPIVVLGGCFGLLMGVLGAAEAERAMNAVGSVGSICLGSLGLLYGIFLALTLPTALGRYLETGDLGAAFRFGEVVALTRDYLGGWIVVLVVSLVISMVAGLVGVVLCVVGTLFTSFLATVITGYLWGDAYRQARAGSLIV